jgi:nitroreductase
MTGLTADEFHALVPIFHAACEAYMERRTIDGYVRRYRRSVSYATSPLPTTEDKLLFILTSLKQNPTHVMHGHIFQMSRSNVSTWAPLVHEALNDALLRQNLLPARNADELARRLREDPPPSTAPTPLLSMMAENVLFIVRVIKLIENWSTAARRNAIRSKMSLSSMSSAPSAF